MDPWSTLEVQIMGPRPEPFRCLVHEPDGPAPGAGWPLVLFLHGAGEKGCDLDALRAAPLPRVLSGGLRPPARVVCPQCPDGPGWPTERLLALVDALAADPAVDAARLHVTGVSMGGRGTWELAYWCADRLAGIAPVCGFGIPNLAPRLADLPVWAFHGAADEVLPAARSREMHDALRPLNPRACLTVLSGAGHEIGEAVYARPELWRWLLRQRRGPAAEPAHPVR